MGVKHRVDQAHKKRVMDAHQTLREFQTFLQRGTNSVWKDGRRSMTPSMVLTQLRDPDVAELLGPERCEKIRRAAELVR